MVNKGVIAIVGYGVGLFLHACTCWTISLSYRYGYLSCYDTESDCEWSLQLPFAMEIVSFAMAMVGFMVLIWLQFEIEGRPWYPQAAAGACLFGAILNMVAGIIFGLNTDVIFIKWLGRSFILAGVGAFFELFAGFLILFSLLNAKAKAGKVSTNTNDTELQNEGGEADEGYYPRQA